MDCKVAELRAGADLTRTWIHMDMDAFFASVEELDDPSLVWHVLLDQILHALSARFHLLWIVLPVVKPLL